MTKEQRFIAAVVEFYNELNEMSYGDYIKSRLDATLDSYSIDIGELMGNKAITSWEGE